MGLGVLGGAQGCSPSAFACLEADDCRNGDVAGVCQATGYCSFPDETCPSQQRYGARAVEGLAGECVPVDDAPGSGTGSETGGGPSSSATSLDSTTASPATGSPDTTDPDTTDTSSTTAPTSTTDPTTDPTNPNGACGDGMIDADEACDGQELAGASCLSQGYDGGVLACSPSCDQLDLAGCFACNDGETNPGEGCDTEPAYSCGELGFGAGMTSCAADCSGIDTSGCGPLTCGIDAPAPVAPCPPQCDVCNGGYCILECEEDSSCAGTQIECPAGWACSVECDGDSACAGAEVQCPANHDCRVGCNGTSACADLTLQCSDDGVCSIFCADQPGVCTGSNVQCGRDFCYANCDQNPEPTLDCGDSCDCTPC